MLIEPQIGGILIVLVLFVILAMLALFDDDLDDFYP